MTPLSTNSILQKLQSRPRMIAGIFIVIVWLWLSWQISQVAFDRDLSESDLISQQVRVQQERLDRLTTELQAYRSPVAVESLPTTPFIVNPETSVDTES